MNEYKGEAVFLVPARAGSKGLPGKNLVELSGRPLIEWTLSSAYESRLGFRLCVSTDSAQILRMSSHLGFEAVLRSPEAATDESLARDVVQDFIIQNGLSNNKDLAIVYLQPTSPLRTGDHVKQAYELFLRSGRTPVTSIVSPSLTWEKFVNFSVEGFLSSGQNLSTTINRQQGGAYMYPNGAIYIFTIGAFLSAGDIPVEGSLGYVMDKRSSLDVDDAIDLLIAEGRMN